MMARNIWVPIILTLIGCVTTTSTSMNWTQFTAGVSELGTAELVDVRDEAIKRYRAHPDDETRMRLSFILSLPDALTQDLAESDRLLTEIDSESGVAPLRDALKREIALVVELQMAQRKIGELQSRLEALKAIEADMTEDKKTIDELSQ